MMNGFRAEAAKEQAKQERLEAKGKLLVEASLHRLAEKSVESDTGFTCFVSLPSLKSID
jgi:hypothetical protein